MSDFVVLVFIEFLFPVGHACICGFCTLIGVKGLGKLAVIVCLLACGMLFLQNEFYSCICEVEFGKELCHVL